MSECEHKGHKLRDGEWFCLYCGEAHEPEPTDRTIGCDCNTPLLIPCADHHRGDELPKGRAWLICVICGHWHEEQNPDLVEAVHDDQEAWNMYQDGEAERLAQLPRCARWYDGHRPPNHRFIPLRSGKEVCRDCGKDRTELEP